LVVPSQPECHLCTIFFLARNNLFILGKREFGLGHPGWGRENRKPFFKMP